MDPLSTAGTIAGVITLWQKVMHSATMSKSDPEELIAMAHRISGLLLLMRSWLSEIDLDEQSEGRRWNEYRAFLSREIQEIYLQVRDRSESTSVKRGQMGKRAESLSQLAERIQNLAHSVRDLAQLEASKRTQQHLGTILEMMGKSSRESVETWETVRSIKQHTEAGANLDSELAAALKKMEEDHPEWSSNEKQQRIDEVRTILRLKMKNNDQFDRDRMTFPFFIVVQDSDPLETRVKLDTGSRPNWISVQLLSRAAISFHPEQDLGQFFGAGKDALPFEPLGVASVPWFSENQARTRTTRTTKFLVHNGELPVSVLLGSKWVLEDMAHERFPEPVLPVVRHILNSGELSQLETHAREDGEGNDRLIDLQNQQRKAKREEKRLLKAASRAMTPKSAVSLFGSVAPIGVTPIRRGSLASVAPSFIISPQITNPTPETTVPTGFGYSEAGESSTAQSSGS
ncbi:hypothetical protein CTA2_8265 [Colletotrichum tanaceti]|uniref:Uncharacterized protein n=1 Tax=Colletotrichum tanaceti TaxID=1306861 RepID=A0A4U6X2H6_9PEZI|nr:hypothetical protein CTA2_8265 [Colletotrichum tanaceti]TKW49588.1 hypothetical protein CTA1_8416 [Colletotrichum tanaceti]